MNFYRLLATDFLISSLALMRSAIVVALISSTLLSGCGGGGGGGVAGGGGVVPPGDGGGNGGVGGTGVVAQGSISAFGSVIVNGTKFETLGTTKFVVNDNVNATPEDLKLGMVVDIQALSFSTTPRTEATLITYHNKVRGPVDSIAADCASMVVLGQTIQVDAAVQPSLTTGACDFKSTPSVEISGLVVDPPKNVIRATRIDPATAADSLQVSGQVASADAATKLLIIGALQVDYGGAVVTPANATLGAGALVTITGASIVNSKLVATSIVIAKPGLSAASGTLVELEGFIVSPAGKSFTVNGQAVDGSTAVIEPAGTVLLDEFRVEIEGKLNDAGVIIATKIEIKPEAPLRIESNVEAKTASTLTLLGQNIMVVSTTELEDESNAKIRAFMLAHVKVGDHVTVNCYRNKDGQLIATKLKRDDPQATVVIEGPLESADSAGNSFALLYQSNVRVTIGATTQIKDKTSVLISAADFFAVAVKGEMVRAEGKLSAVAGTLDATAGKVDIRNANGSPGSGGGPDPGGEPDSGSGHGSNRGGTK